MDQSFGPSNRRKCDPDGYKEFERKNTIDLVRKIPECKSSQMVENLNDVFGLLEEKLGMMCRVMTSLVCQDSARVFTPVEILKRVVDDCQGLSSLLQFQKLKLTALGHDMPMSIASTDALRENSILRKMFSGKRKLPITPWPLIEPEKKKKKLHDMQIENVYRSVYREFLLFPSPIFKLTEFMSMMRTKKSSNKFVENQVHLLVQELIRRKMISGFPIDNGIDSLIVKELNMGCIELHLKVFSLTEDEYISASVPKSLLELKEIVKKLDQQIIEHLDSQLWMLLANIIMATVVKDPKMDIGHDEFPENVPKAVMKATHTLSRVKFIELGDTSNQTTMKFVKNVNKETIALLGKTFGQSYK